MKFTISTLLTVLAVKAAAIAVPSPDALPEPQPISLARSNPLQKRDVWCRVEPDEVYVRCRAGPSTTYEIKKWIRADERFGVSCKKRGQNVMGVE